MAFEFEQRLASELNRLADEASHDVKRSQQEIERLKAIAAEIKARVLGAAESEHTPGKRTIDPNVTTALTRIDAIVDRTRGFSSGLPWQRPQRATFDDYRVEGLREVLSSLKSRKLRASTVASADADVVARANPR